MGQTRKSLFRRTLSMVSALLLLIGLMPLGILAAAEEETPAIIPISTLDSQAGWGFAGTGSLDTQNQKQGAGCLTLTGSGTINMNTTSLNIPMPSDWREDWYVECWFYVDDLSKITNAILELSQQVDKIEAAYNLKTIPGIQNGWNKIQLKLGSMWLMQADDFATLKNIRLYFNNIPQGANPVLKLDDIALVRSSELVAHDDAALVEALTAAQEIDTSNPTYLPVNVAAFKDALAKAQAVKAAYDSQNKPSQRDVEAATEYLNATMAKLEYDPGTSPSKLLTLGRTYYKGTTLYLDWTNSGFSMNFNGTGVTAQIDVTIKNNGPGYLNVYVDGALVPTSTITVDKNGSYVLASGLPAGPHTLTVRKRCETTGYGAALIAIKEVAVTGGTFSAPPARAARQIEFVGDSITSGFGNMVTDGQGNYSSHNTNGNATYATMTAAAFGAEAQVISRSGIRFGRYPDKPETDSWIPHYAKTASIGGGDTSDWDFAARPSDVVVINLGTNDAGARMGDGSAISASLYQSEAKALLQLVRQKNPNAYIVWVYGMMGINATVASGIQAAVNELNDPKISYLPLTPLNNALEGTGIGNHPTITSSLNRSYVLTEYIAQLTGWDYNYKPQLAMQLDLVKDIDDEWLKPYTKETADALKEAIDAAKALLADNNATNQQIKDATNAIQVALKNLLTEGIDYSMARIDISSGEVEAMNATVAGMQTSVTVEQLSDGKYAYKLPVQNHGFGLQIDTHVLDSTTKNVTFVVEILMPTDVTQANTRLNLRYTNTAGETKSNVIRQADIPAEYQGKWYKWVVTATDAAMNRKVDGGTDFNIIKYGYNNEATDNQDYVYIRSITVFPSPDKSSLQEALEFDETGWALTEEYLNAKAHAQAVMNDKGATPNEVKAATDALWAAIQALEEAEPTLPNWGDVNGDGKINATDARLALQAAVGKIILTEEQIAVANVDGKGDPGKEITATDARLILQYAVQKIDKFPVEQE